MLVQLHRQITKTFEVIKHNGKLVRVHLRNQKLLFVKQLVSLVLNVHCRGLVLLQVLLGQSFQIEFRNVLDPELDTDLLEQHVVAFVLDGTQQSLDLVTFNDVVVLVNHDFLLQIIVEIRIGIIMCHMQSLLQFCHYCFNLRVIMIHFSLNQRVHHRA